MRVYNVEGTMCMLKPLYCCEDYLVDSDGYIISKQFHRPMKPSVNPNGYLVTMLTINGKYVGMPIHSAVARTFLGDETVNGKVVNHKDGNKQNNRLDNLEWVTPKENSNHAVNVLGVNMGSRNGNAKPVYGIDKKTGELKYEYDCMATCARDICGNVHYRYVQNSIWKVIHGLRKSYKGCYWTYDKPN